MTRSPLLGMAWPERPDLSVAFNWRVVFALMLNVTAWFGFASLA